MHDNNTAKQREIAEISASHIITPTAMTTTTTAAATATKNGRKAKFLSLSVDRIGNASRSVALLLLMVVDGAGALLRRGPLLHPIFHSLAQSNSFSTMHFHGL